MMSPLLWIGSVASLGVEQMNPKVDLEIASFGAAFGASFGAAFGASFGAAFGIAFVQYLLKIH